MQTPLSFTPWPRDESGLFRWRRMADAGFAPPRSTTSAPAPRGPRKPDPLSRHSLSVGAPGHGAVRSRAFHPLLSGPDCRRAIGRRLTARSWPSGPRPGPRAGCRRRSLSRPASSRRGRQEGDVAHCRHGATSPSCLRSAFGQPGASNAWVMHTSTKRQRVRGKSPPEFTRLRFGLISGVDAVLLCATRV
jgi:hypothetical protein